MTVKDELQKIYDQQGRLTPELVVAAARRKEHPLHTHVFDRAPKDAAEAWYRHRAHELIQSVRVVYRQDGDETRSVRAFQAIRQESGYSYEPTERVIQDPFLSKLVMMDMEREWQQLRTRYEHFREFWEMVKQDSVKKAA